VLGGPVGAPQASYELWCPRIGEKFVARLDIDNAPTQFVERDI